MNTDEMVDFIRANRNKNSEMYWCKDEFNRLKDYAIANGVPVEKEYFRFLLVNHHQK